MTTTLLLDTMAATVAATKLGRLSSEVDRLYAGAVTTARSAAVTIRPAVRLVPGTVAELRDVEASLRRRVAMGEQWDERAAAEAHWRGVWSLGNTLAHLGDGLDGLLDRLPEADRQSSPWGLLKDRMAEASLADSLAMIIATLAAQSSKPWTLGSLGELLEEIALPPGPESVGLGPLAVVLGLVRAEIHAGTLPSGSDEILIEEIADAVIAAVSDGATAADVRDLLGVGLLDPGLLASLIDQVPVEVLAQIILAQLASLPLAPPPTWLLDAPDGLLEAFLTQVATEAAGLDALALTAVLAVLAQLDPALATSVDAVRTALLAIGSRLWGPEGIIIDEQTEAELRAVLTSLVDGFSGFDGRLMGEVLALAAAGVITGLDANQMRSLGTLYGVTIDTAMDKIEGLVGKLDSMVDLLLTLSGYMIGGPAGSLAGGLVGKIIDDFTGEETIEDYEDLLGDLAGAVLDDALAHHPDTQGLRDAFMAGMTDATNDRL